jgi:hypothetical protein
MRINPKIIEVCQKGNIDISDAILFCFAVNNQQYPLLDRLLERGILDENEHIFRINLCNLDEEGNLGLRYSLYTNDELPYSYTGFKKLLYDNYNMTLNGHVNNIRPFKVMDDAENEYNSLLLSIPDIDIQKLARVVSDYYSKTEFCTGFKKFFREDAKLAYDNFDNTIQSGLL